MAGRSEDVQRWSEKLQGDLMNMITPLCDRLIQTEDSVEITFIQKKCDGAGKVARAVRSVRVMAGTTRVPASKAPQDPPPAVSAPAPKDEAPMDDRTDWTPERIGRLHAEFDRRLDKLFQRRECKGMAEGAPSGGVGGLASGPPADGAPPTSPD